MALVVSDGVVSGKIGGKVFMRNGRVRNFAIPSNPRSLRQVAQRAAYSQVSSYWGGGNLSDDEMAGWIAYAAGTPTTNRVGQTVYLTGKNWFQRFNVPRVNALAGILDAAPAIGQLPENQIPAGVALVAEGTSPTGGIAVSMSVLAMAAGDRALVYVSRPVSPTSNRFGPYQLVGQKSGPVVAAASIYSASPFGTQVEGARCKVKLVIFSSTVPGTLTLEEEVVFTAA